jgi:arsenite methyltransferase
MPAPLQMLVWHDAARTEDGITGAARRIADTIFGRDNRPAVASAPAYTSAVRIAGMTAADSVLLTCIAEEAIAIGNLDYVPWPEVVERAAGRYAAAARTVLGAAPAADGCCGPSAAFCCGTADAAAAVGGFSQSLYREGETDGLPEEAVLASLGCGNPLAVADLHEGERVLDLGSGGGIDVLLSARRVGPSGFAYGVDMTDEMLTLARANAARAGAGNVEFLKGQIEAVTLPDASVDVVISNCVINLSTDKPAVVAEMFRVLVPGGRIGISDVAAEDHLTPADRAAAGSYVGCIAGALSRAEYVDGLAAAGFTDATVTFTPRGGARNALGHHPRRQARQLVTTAPGRRLVAEFTGTSLLTAVVVGSGIAATRLTDDGALRLLANSLVTALGLPVLILVFSPAGGAHFNPLVTLADWILRRGNSLAETIAVIGCQIAGAVSGAALAEAPHSPLENC